MTMAGITARTEKTPQPKVPDPVEGLVDAESED